MDAEPGGELAGPGAHRFGHVSRTRRLPAAAADSPLHAHRRRAGRSARSPPYVADVAIRPDHDGRHAGRARLLRLHPDLAHPGVVVHHRLRPGIRRPGVPVAHPVARRQAGSHQRDRAQFDSVQRGARARTAPGRPGPRGVRHARIPGVEPGSHGGVFHAQRAVLSGRHLRPGLAPRAAHSADNRPADDRGAARRPALRETDINDSSAHRPGFCHGISGDTRPDAFAGLRAGHLRGGGGRVPAGSWRFQALVRLPARSSSRRLAADSSEWAC